MNPQQQAQILRQQQLRAMAMQQQQMQIMGMGMGGMSMMGGMGMGMTPQLLQQQMYQLQATLQNPQLPPVMRAQYMQQLQQANMMAVQMGLMPGAPRGHLAQAYGGNSRGTPPTGPRARPAVAGGGAIPTGPRGDAGKRQRSVDIKEVQPAKKRIAGDEVPAGPDGA